MTRQERIKAAVELVMSKNYGDTISHEELLAAMQEQGMSRTYRDAIQAAAKQCINGGKMIESIHSYGYRVVNPDDYTRQATRRLMAGARKIDSGAKILQYAPVKDMSVDGLETYTRVTDRMRILQASVAGAQVEIRMLDERRRHPLAIERT